MRKDNNGTTFNITTLVTMPTTWRLQRSPLSFLPGAHMPGPGCLARDLVCQGYAIWYPPYELVRCYCSYCSHRGACVGTVLVKENVMAGAAAKEAPGETTPRATSLSSTTTTSSSLSSSSCPLCKNLLSGPCGSLFEAWLKCTEEGSSRNEGSTMNDNDSRAGAACVSQFRRFQNCQEQDIEQEQKQKR
jgi:hypothetical protein